MTARGLERTSIFRDDRDRMRMLELLEEMVERYGVRIHAFVLMSNHYHLLVETPEGNLSRAMQWLNVGYSVWFNRRHRRCGSLFQGRFKAEILEPREAALKVTRYLHLNPVRTRASGLSKRERDIEDRGLGPALSRSVVRKRIQTLRRYPWSSYLDYVAKRAVHTWVQTEATLESLGGPAASRKAWYRAYVEAALRSGLPETPWDRLEAGLVLGGPSFRRRVRQSAQGNAREQKALRQLSRPGGLTFEQVVHVVEKIKREPWASFRDRHGDWGRDAVLYLARRRGRFTLAELAERAGLSNYMAVALAVSRFKIRMGKDRNLSAVANQAADRLINV
ncbi:MAG: transposase [bacterium]